MVDLDGLKKRIELIDVRFKSAQSTRERESAALKQLWDQVQNRLHAQRAQIELLRGQVSDLEDVRDELLGLVQGLLGIVEGEIEAMADETVPQIRELATSLLGENEPPLSARAMQRSVPQEISPPETEQPQNDALPKDEQDELLAAIERSLDDEIIPTELPEQAKAKMTLGSTADDEDDEATEEISLKPLSPGIRKLVERLEGVIDNGDTASPDDVEGTDENKDEVFRDLKEIEALRGELLGLRERIAGESR